MKNPSLVFLVMTFGALVGCNNKPGATNQAGVASQGDSNPKAGLERHMFRESLVTPANAVVFARIAHPYADRAYCWYTYRESGTESLNKIPAKPELVKQKLKQEGSVLAMESMTDKLDHLEMNEIAVEPLEASKADSGASSDLVESLASKISSGVKTAAGASGNVANALTDFVVTKWLAQSVCDLSNPQKCESMKPSVAQLALFKTVLERLDQDASKDPRQVKATDTETCASSKGFWELGPKR